MKDISSLLQGASLGSVLAGNSIVDYPSLQIKTLEEADAFIECYGYNRLQDKREIESLRLEALSFLQTKILDNQITIPEKVRSMQDLRYILLWASNKKLASEALWCCSLLRVMHTFAHCSSFFNEYYHSEIREQIVSKIEKHIYTCGTSKMLGDLKLIDFQCRPKKSRESATIKLLHKPENVAADIFDWIGVRFITKYRLDAIKVLSYLRKHNVIMFANVKPSRSRNTLIDLEWLNDNWDKSDFETLKLQLELIDPPQEQGKPLVNFHTMSEYHAVQFTCRQRIKIVTSIGEKVSFFFPFEVQILDQKSYKQNRIGDASHELYKKRQLSAVRKRVLGALYQKFEKANATCEVK